MWQWAGEIRMFSAPTKLTNATDDHAASPWNWSRRYDSFDILRENG